MSEILDLKKAEDAVFMFSAAYYNNRINTNKGQNIYESQRLFRERLDNFRFKLFN